MSVETILRNMVALGATWVLWCLVGLSVLAFAVILERCAFFLSTRFDDARAHEQLEEALFGGKKAELQGLFAESRSIEAQIAGAVFKASHPAEAEELMAVAASRQRERSERNLAFLGTLGNNAPFIGLLGTVIGIMGAFGQLDVSQGQLTSGLMAEIGEALVATAVGLLVALPAVAAYNALGRTVSVRLSRGEALGRRVIAALHVKAPSSGRRVPARSDVRDIVEAIS